MSCKLDSMSESKSALASEAAATGGQVVNRLREIRVAAGLSQQALAEAAGLTRQAVNAVEGGHYLPNTSVALKLAQLLGCRVEELFRLTEETPRCAVRLWRKRERESTRVALARVRGRVVAHPLTQGMALREGFSSADGLIEGSGDSARLFIERDRLDTTALLMGCDPSLGILATHMERAAPGLRLIWLPSPSRAALQAVAGGGVHIAGSHMRDPRSGEFNLVQARKALAPAGGLLVAFAGWEQGLMVRRGNPKRLRAVSDLARKKVRFVNREKGAGSREVFDSLLAQAGVPHSAIAGYDSLAGSHMAVAHAVAAGGADAGIGLRAVAYACGLDFVPLTAVRFDFVIPEDCVEHVAVAATLDLLQSRKLRDDLAALPGYDVSRMGSVLARFEPGAA